MGYQEVTPQYITTKEWIHRAQAWGKWKIAWQLQAYYIKGGKKDQKQNKACKWGKHNWTGGNSSQQHHIVWLNKSMNVVF